MPERPEVTDEFWDSVSPLLPEPQRDPSAGGRPRNDPRRILAGVLHVLRTGCPWKEVNPEIGPGSTLHRYWRAWERAGVFHRIWVAGLAEAEEMEGIAWRWQKTGGGGRRWVPAAGERRRSTGPAPAAG